MRHAACIEDINFKGPRGLNRQQVLTLGSCAWVGHGHNVIIIGPTEIGKSYWAGWNDPAGDWMINQTTRLVDFMVTYFAYEQRASTVAVAIWRHKLMHTAQPRVLRAKNGIDRFTWETGINLKDHVTLSPTGTPNEFMVRFDSYAVIHDLRREVLEPSGYFSDLCTSPDLQQKFLACYNEMENYTVDA